MHGPSVHAASPELARKVLQRSTEKILAFPHSVPSPAPQSARVPSEGRLRRGSLGTVLVVEDEPLMRLFVVRALQGAGYDTLEADSAERALQLLEEDGRCVHSLVTDVKLPGASGVELAEQARQLLPGLPTVLMSGSGRHVLVDERLITRDADLLQKPFRIADLLSKLERISAPAPCLGVPGS